MNNALIQNTLEEEAVDIKPALIERATELTDLVEALSNIAQSEYWQVISKEFNRDLQSLVGRLENEKDTSVLFSLQGEIRGIKKFDLIKLLEKKRRELESNKQKINAN